VSKLSSPSEAAAAVPDGARIAFGGGGALMRRPIGFSRELIRRQARELHVHSFLGGLEIDLLIAASAVASTNCAYLGLLEFGQAPCFQRAAREATLQVNEYSEFSFMGGLHAADMGLPFIPWKTPWGSDITRELKLKTVRDPYGELELLALPATHLDVAVIHAGRADADGYVELPDAPDLVWDYDHLIARVADVTIVCAEEIGPPRDPARVAIVGREVAHVVHMPGGAWPAGLHPLYEPDVDHVLQEYIPAAQAGGEALEEYLQRHVHERTEAVGIDG
jgi:glutaconate CoA-transferase, subunit A